MGVLLGDKSGSPSALLAALVLSACFWSTEAVMKPTNVTVEPPKPMEGGSVRFTPVTVAIAPVSCRWFRGEPIQNNTILVVLFYPSYRVRKSTSYTGRETMRPDCSLEISNLNITDLANYMVVIEGPEDTRAGSVELIVHYSKDDTPSFFGRKLNRMTIVGIVFGSMSAAVVLGVVCFTIYRVSRQRIPMRFRAAPPALVADTVL